MLIECLYTYEYFVNLKKMVNSTTQFNKNDLLYCNIMLFWLLLTSWFLSPPTYQRLSEFFHPLLSFKGPIISFTNHYFSCPPLSGNDDGPVWSLLPTYVYQFNRQVYMYLCYDVFFIFLLINWLWCLRIWTIHAFNLHCEPYLPSGVKQIEILSPCSTQESTLLIWITNTVESNYHANVCT